MHARVKSPVSTVRTRSSTDGIVVLMIVAILGLPMLAGAQQDANLPAARPTVTINQPVPAQEPTGSYVAEVIGNDVFIRSGSGTNFYQCGKLYAGDHVQVINAKDGWSCIVPPPGCFSWVSMQYVSINLENPTMGIITGDNVGVYAGSDFVLPMHSTSKQVVLNRGQGVKLLGEEKDDYYKIAPPQGANLWVSSQFLQPVEKMAVKTPNLHAGTPVPGTPSEKPTVVDPNFVPKTDLDIYYALAEQVQVQRAKPVSQQDYAAIKTKLTEIAAKKDAGRAARYAEYTLKQIDRFELACKAAKELELQNKERQKVVSKIDEARAAKLAQIDDKSRFAVMGKLENSSVYDASGPARRFRLVDPSGKTICYVVPKGAAASQDYSKFIGRRVGLVGQIEPHEATSRATIEFTEVVLLDPNSP